MSPCSLSLLSLLAASSVPPYQPFNASVVDGTLTAPGIAPCYLGNTTSQLSNALSSLYSPLTPTFTLPLKNATSFYSYFSIAGTYDADTTLQLLPSVALLFASSGASITVPSSFPDALFVINATNAHYSAVIAPGGPSTASILCSPEGLGPGAVLAAGSDGFVIDGLRIVGCGGTAGSAIHVRGLPFSVGGEVANCDIFDAGSRAVWTESCSGVAIHGNFINNSMRHTIDQDAYSSNVVVYNNTVAWSGQEAVFIEQGATNIIVVDNDIGPGNSVGIAIYNNDFPKATAQHVIMRNRIFGCGKGISTGSGPHSEGQLVMGVIIAGNQMWNNNGTGFRTNGNQVGTLYFANDDADGITSSNLNGITAKNISFADPNDRVKIG